MIKALCSIFLILLPLTNQHFNKHSTNIKHSHHKNEESTLNEWTKQIYTAINDDELNIEVLRKMLMGYSKLRDQGEIKKSNIISIIDFSKSSNQKRLFIIDIDNKKLIFKELVAHGINTGVEFAKNFSNQKFSNKSSLGFFITGKTYSGKNGFSLKLHGKEKHFNSKAFERGIVMHGADYVSEQFIKQNGRLGRSFGCPAVETRINKAIINTIKDGSCLFIYHPKQNYLQHSSLIN